MPNDVTPSTRTNYCRVLLSAILADGDVDDAEVVKLYETFTALQIPREERLSFLEEVAFRPGQLQTAEVDEQVLQSKELSAALAHDVLFIEQVTDDAPTAAAVASILSKVSLTPKQVEVIRSWVSMENEILRKLGAGEEWMADSTMAELGSRAAAVGVPLTALYHAGIVGFGATGLTSGLATLGGMSGLTVLGLNPMTAGIAATIMAGITVKKLADYALGTNERERVKTAIEAAHKMRLQAAMDLASDMGSFQRGPVLEILGRRGKARKELVRSMKGALAYMRGGAAPGEAPVESVEPASP